MSVKMPIFVFWVVMPCGLVGGCQHFEGTLVAQKTMIYIICNLFILGLASIMNVPYGCMLLSLRCVVMVLFSGS
jgi:hypothetical protein